VVVATEHKAMKQQIAKDNNLGDFILELGRFAT